jgi:hypothetical protein
MKKICKNCKWWYKEAETCRNEYLSDLMGIYMLYIPSSFGCIKFQPKKTQPKAK